PEAAANAVKFLLHLHTEEIADALTGYAPAWRKTQHGLAWHHPLDRRSNVMRRTSQCESSPFPEAAVHFDSRCKLFGTKRAPNSCWGSKRTAHTSRIPEFPRASVDILCSDEILADVPQPYFAGEDELRLEFPLLFLTGFTIRYCQIRDAIKSN